MFVKLKRAVFLGGHLYTPQEAAERGIPAEFRDMLPKDAKVLSAQPAPKAEEPAPSLRDLDTERAAADAEEKAAEDAEKTRLANAEKVRRELAAEKAGKGK